MLSSFIPMIPIIIPFLLFFITWAFVLSIRKHNRSKGLRLPSTNDCLRSPGQSLIQELDVLNERITEYTVCVLFFPTALYAIYISYLFVNVAKPTPSNLGIVAGVIVITIVACLIKIAVFMRRYRQVRLRYEGAVTVGQELNQLLRDGYAVYHDFPADTVNIAHVVVGRKGIFTIETKARSAPTGGQSPKDATVEYNGTALLFPKHTDSQTLEQAEQQSKWLSKWISGAIEEDVAARAVVALPGWYVKRTSSDGISVVSPNQFASFFEHIGPRDLTDETLERIAHHLEQRCRHVDTESTISEEEKNRV